jgi:hypothetical protein
MIVPKSIYYTNPKYDASLRTKNIRNTSLATQYPVVFLSDVLQPIDREENEYQLWIFMSTLGVSDL